MKKKYVICPSHVVSRNDGELHYIDAPTLMRLYGVNPMECIVNRDRASMRDIDTMKLIWLAPRYDGKYQLPKG